MIIQKTFLKKYSIYEYSCPYHFDKGVHNKFLIFYILKFSNLIKKKVLKILVLYSLDQQLFLTNKDSVEIIKNLVFFFYNKISLTKLTIFWSFMSKWTWVGTPWAISGRMSLLELLKIKLWISFSTNGSFPPKK